MKLLATAVAIGAIAAGSAHAGTVIYNTGDAATATIALGVNDDGSLNTTPDVVENSSRTGIAYKMTQPGGTTGFYDATSPGCFCEGWGVSVGSGGSAVAGWANVAAGGGGLELRPVTGITGSSVTTSATLADLPGVSVTQTYAVSDKSPNALFEATVTITNTTGAALNDVRYVRVMDWDVPFTEFSEFVTIRGTATTTLLEYSNDNGFCTSDPRAVCNPSVAGTADTDFTDVGPADHGAYFRFNFGTIAAGESYTFNIFYGAAASESEALAAVAAEEIELFSFGQSNGGQTTGSPATFIFGFSGVGGTAIGDVPEPASIALAGLALAGLGAARRRKAVRG